MIIQLIKMHFALLLKGRSFASVVFLMLASLTLAFLSIRVIPPGQSQMLSHSILFIFHLLGTVAFIFWASSLPRDQSQFGSWHYYSSLLVSRAVFYWSRLLAFCGAIIAIWLFLSLYVLIIWNLIGVPMSFYSWMIALIGQLFGWLIVSSLAFLVSSLFKGQGGGLASYGLWFILLILPAGWAGAAGGEASMIVSLLREATLLLNIQVFNISISDAQSLPLSELLRIGGYFVTYFGLLHLLSFTRLTVSLKE